MLKDCRVEPGNDTMLLISRTVRCMLVFFVNGWVAAQKNGAVFVLQRRFVFYGVVGRTKGLRKLELVDCFG